MVNSKRGSFDTSKSKKEEYHLRYTLLSCEERQLGRWGICSYIAELLKNMKDFYQSPRHTMVNA